MTRPISITILEGAEAQALQDEINAAIEEVAQFMREHGITSGEGLVLSDPPVSDDDIV